MGQHKVVVGCCVVSQDVGSGTLLCGAKTDHLELSQHPECSASLSGLNLD